MMKYFQKVLFALFIAFSIDSCSQKQEPKTIYLVRHAEKVLVGDDPELSVAGTARAKKLAQILADKNIDHAYSTNTIRTIATIQPLMDAQTGLSVEIYDVKNHDELVKDLRTRKGNAVVVGHSNTIHHVVNYFVQQGEKFPELQDIEYDFIFVVTLEKDGSSKVERKVFKDFN
ncbi:phosphoglycerate mutase family protein [Shivajiella indica]|uniref:Phosphoglycerate mutase family protein n=1 Tax=Shivajiella indica TaxID=872115 RepID=A0ABW5B6K4_9BACT